MPALASPPAAPSTIVLSAGQQYRVWIRFGSVIAVQSGAVALCEAPQWIAETMLGMRVELQEGQHYLSERSGWTCITASRPVQLLLYPAANRAALPFGLLLRWATAAMQRLRSSA